MRERKRHLIILGGGFLGSHIASLASCPVTVVDKEQDKCSHGVLAHDLTAPASVQYLKTLPQPTHVITAVSSQGKSEQGKGFYSVLAEHVVKAYPHARHIFCSSASVYGVTDGSFVNDDSPCHLLGLPRIDDLLAAESTIMGTEGFCILRLTALYGRGRCAVLDRWLSSLQPISGEAERYVNYVEVADAARAILLLTEQDYSSLIANVSDASPLTLRQIYAELSRLTGHPMPTFSPSLSESRRGRTNQRILPELLQALGWKPETPSLLHGISKLLSLHTHE